MPLPKPLPEVQQDLRELLVQDPGATIGHFQQLLPDNADKKNQAILLEGRWHQIEKNYKGSLVRFDDYKLETAQISATLLTLINALAEPDFERPAAVALKNPVPKFVIIYASEDEPHHHVLRKHLTVLEKITKRIQVYGVQETRVGDPLENAREEIKTADYLLVLITANLFASADWFGLVYEAIGQGRRIIPIRIENAFFEGTGLDKLKSLPTQNRAIQDFRSLDEAYVNIVQELTRLLPAPGK